MALRFLTAGESHGPGLTGICEGCPAGLQLTDDVLNADLARRQQGVGRGGRMQIEEDAIQITGGVRFGRTLGGPISLWLPNRDWPNWQERMQIGPLAADQAVPDPTTLIRPGHIDLAGTLKFGATDVRDALERASARETAMRVALGGIAKQVLAVCGIQITSRVIQFGALDFLNRTPPCYHRDCPTQRDWDTHATDLLAEGARALASHEDSMRAESERAAAAGTTLGGAFQVLAYGAPAGLGNFVHWDRRLDGLIGQALMSIPTVKAVAIGAGTDLAGQTGQASNDALFPREPADIQPGGPWWYRTTNQMGGLEGGVTNGEPVIATCHLKPISTQMQPLASIDLATGQAASAFRERSDTAVVEAAAVVGEAMLAWVLAGALVDKFGGDHIADLDIAYRTYVARIHTRPNP